MKKRLIGIIKYCFIFLKYNIYKNNISSSAVRGPPEGFP